MVEPGKAGSTPPSNLPTQLTSLVGREHEIAEVCGLLLRDDVRLLTLTGPPGIGKTRLALHAARNLLTHLRDGVYFVNLAPISDPQLVMQAVAGTLGVSRLGKQPLLDILTTALADKQMLLLLDNFEQVVPAGTEVAGLLRATPGLKVIVTSRELLRVSGEHAFVVPPLSMPPVLTPASDIGRLAPPSAEQLSQYEAVHLFVDRAGALKPDFVLTAENASIVGEICRRLDGLPLAIELAAARVRHLPLEAILERLRHSLHLLTGGALDLPARQRTLRATIEWSHALLDSEEAKLFQRLAAFRGGRTLDAIEAVCNIDHDLGVDPLALVSSLTDKSLMFQVPRVRGEPRYVLLETIYEFAREKLEQSGEEQAVRRQHATYFAELAERTEPRLMGLDQVEWLDRLDAEQDNFRAALDWAYDNDVALGLKLAAGLSTFWNRRGYLHEGRERSLAILARAREIGAARTFDTARVLYTVGLIAFRQGDFVPARSVLMESVDVYRDPGNGKSGRTAHSSGLSDLAESLNVLGIVESRLENVPARLRLHEEALAIAEEAGDTWSVARSLFQLGHTARLSGDYELARTRFEESLKIFRMWGDQFNIALALAGLGLIDERKGDYLSAEQLLNQALTLFKELGDTWAISSTLFSLASVAQRMKDYAKAWAMFEENLALIKELGAKSDLGEAFGKLGRIAYLQGDFARALEFQKQALARFRDLQDKVGTAPCLMDAAGIVATAGAAATLRRRRQNKAELAERLATVAQAVELMGAAESLYENLGIQLDPEGQELFGAYCEAARGALGKRAFNEALARGETMDSEHAVDLAMLMHLPESAEKPGQASFAAPAEKGAAGGLTRREREVAALVAQGKSNREIADSLVITERTVEGHVSNLLAKLDFRSRSQISAWAVEQGLTRAAS